MKRAWRDFVLSAASLTAGLATGAAGGRDPLMCGALLHLGHNMWDDFADDSDGWAKSAEEGSKRVHVERWRWGAGRADVEHGGSDVRVAVVSLG